MAITTISATEPRTERSGRSDHPGSLAPHTLERETLQLGHPKPGERTELAFVLALSVLTHAGVGTAAYSAREDAPAPRAVSRVEIDIARPAPPPPPPPPPLKKDEPRPEPPKVSAPERPSAPKEQPQPEAPLAPSESPPDTGSDAPAAEGGELFAGHGGLGTSAPTPPAPTPPPAPPAPRVEAKEGANYLKNPRPAYPSFARRQGWEGTALVRIQVLASGRAGAVNLAKSSGFEVLDAAATAAAKAWTFVPASEGGKAVNGWVTVPVVFRLQ
jgi:TonB family protein